MDGQRIGDADKLARRRAVDGQHRPLLEERPPRDVVEEPANHRMTRVFVTHWKDDNPMSVQVHCSCGWSAECGYREEDAAHAAHVREASG